MPQGARPPVCGSRCPSGGPPSSWRLSALRAGDQIRGLSQREARAVLERIAAVHAAYWMDPQLEAHPWLPSHTFWFQFLVGGSEPPAERAGHLFELLEFWHGALVAHGVRDYSLADARYDLQLAALRCLTAVLQLYRFSLDPEITVRAAVLNGEAIQRYPGVMEELGAWEALPGAVLP